MSVQLRRPRAKPPAPRRHPTAIALLLAAVGVWGGCSVESHYGLLSFFFDGVPPPAGVVAETGGGPSGRRVPATPAVTVSAHVAYADRRCEDCHGASANFGFVVSGFTKLGSDACMKCHGDVQTEWSRLHGPVAAGACLWCHQPHESPYPVLLNRASPDLCLQCHQFQLQGTPGIPAHEDLGRDCLGCHRGHGGHAPFFLRAAADAGPEPTGASEGPG